MQPAPLPERVVVDTSVLLRYLIKPSSAIRTLIEEDWLGDQFIMVSASLLIRELEDVLARDSIQKLISVAQGTVLLEAVRAKAELVLLPDEIPPYTRDAKDDKFVACAIAGNAHVLITTDEDILVLKAVGGIDMLTPYQFVSRK